MKMWTSAALALITVMFHRVQPVKIHPEVSIVLVNLATQVMVPQENAKVESIPTIVFVYNSSIIHSFLEVIFFMKEVICR